MGEAEFLRQVQFFRCSHLTFSKSALCCRTTFISKNFQSKAFFLTFVLLKTHSKDPKSYHSSKELRPNVYWLSRLDKVFIFIWYVHFLHERRIRNDEMKFFLTLECNHFPKFMSANVVNMFNNNIIYRHLIVTSNFPQKWILYHLKPILEHKSFHNFE